MSEAALAERMSLAQFLAWSSEGFELHEGRVVAMASPKMAHGIICSNLVAALHPAVRARGCLLLMEAGIVSESKEDSCYQADLAVTCQPHEHGRHTVEQPLLVIEVLSPSTESVDRKVKLPDYHAIPSVQEIALIDQDRLFCELHRRLPDDRWIVELLVKPDATLRLESIDAAIALRDVYDGVDLTPPTPLQAGPRDG